MNMIDVDAHITAVKAGPSGSQIGAFFDFDGTLIDGYSAAAYFIDRVRRRQTGWREIVDMLSLMTRGDLSETEFEDVIRKGVLDWAGQTDDENKALWQRLFKEKFSDWLFPEAWRLVLAHQAMGHTVAIASSATINQALPLAAELGIEHVLCTRPMVRNGKLTGGLAGRPLWGSGKADAVREFASTHDIALKRSYGYANGNEDIPFLDVVGKPTPVNAQVQLMQHAAENRWSTMSFQPRRKSSLESKARTVGAYAAMALTFGLGVGYAKATGRRRQAVDLIGSVGSELALAAAGIDVEVHGEEHLWKTRPALYLINHQSKLDFFVMMYLVRRGFTGVAKKEAANTPGFGPFLRMSDMAFIDRSNNAKAREALQPVVENLKNGLSVCMAPEGTRSCSPKLGAFRKGAFHVAMQAGVPIVPVVLRNAGEMMTRNGQAFRAGKVQVAVLPAIDVGDWTVADLDRRIASVRQQFVDTLNQWPGESVPAPAPARRRAKKVSA